MKFRLSRTSSVITEDDVLTELPNVKKIDCNLYYYYEIELNSLDELIEFREYVKNELIIDSNQVCHTIEIYDDYRE